LPNTFYKAFPVFFQDVSQNSKRLSSSQALDGMDPGWIAPRKQVCGYRNTRRNDEGDHKRNGDGHVQDQYSSNKSSQQHGYYCNQAAACLRSATARDMTVCNHTNDGQGENGGNSTVILFIFLAFLVNVSSPFLNEKYSHLSWRSQSPSDGISVLPGSL
jgi:hypothetical protein